MTSVSSGRRRGLNASTAIKSPCIAASTVNLTLSAEQTVDGIALVSGDRVLVKNQTTGAENGIYAVNTSTWIREPDWDGIGDVVEGTNIPVSRGTSNSDTWWRVTNTGTITVGSTAVTMSQGLTAVAIAATSTVTAESADTTCFPVFMTDATGNNALKSGSNFTFDSANGILGTNAFKFPATQVPSSDVNTLDDYQEGTFTPVLSDGTNNATGNSPSGYYTKIGREVFCRGRLRISSLGSVSGNTKITGLPFTSSGSANSQGTMTCGFAQNLNISAGQSITGLVTSSSTECVLYVWDATGGTTIMQHGEWTATGDIFYSITYQV